MKISKKMIRKTMIAKEKLKLSYSKANKWKCKSYGMPSATENTKGVK